MKRLLPLLAIVTLCSAQPANAAQRWVADPVHSSAQFTATHFGLVRVTGIIPIKEVTIMADKPELPASVTAVLDATGVDTREPDRDGDLKSDHFFNVSTYPTISFTSTSITSTGPKTFDLAGNLTMHGVTKPVVLKATYLGQIVDPRGNVHYAYEAATTIKRSDFGMTYGPVIVGDTVEIAIDIDARAR